MILPDMKATLLLTLSMLIGFRSAAQVTDAGPDVSLCVDFYTMQGSPLPLGAIGLWTMVAGCGTINDPNLPNTQVVNLCVGSNVFQWTVDDGGNITSDIMVITVYDGSMAIANAGMDQTIIAPPNTAYLSGAPQPIYPATCTWTFVSGSGVLVDATDPNTVATGLTVGDNIFCWTCYNGPCGTSTDTVTVQMMLMTGMANGVAPAAEAFRFDPATQQLSFLGPGQLDEVTVLDMQGRSVQAVQRPTGRRRWDMAGAPQGLYIARAWVDGVPMDHRFVVAY